MFKTLLELDTIRGPHSTGVITVNPHTYVSEYSKELGTPWDFFKKSHLFDDKGNFYRATCALIGHNRLATQGAINKENAHPFDFPNIVGVHNGTLEQSSFRELKEGGSNFEVDSEALYHRLNDKPLKKVLPELSGAWALFFYDKKNKTIRLIRNSQRPLSYAFSKDGKTLFFASEGWMIDIAARKNNVKIQDVLEVKENLMHYIHLDKLGKGLNLYYNEEPIKPKPIVITQHTYTSYPQSWIRNTPRVDPRIAEILDEDNVCAIYYEDGKITKGQTFCSVEMTSLNKGRTVKLFINNHKGDMEKLLEDLTESGALFTVGINSVYTIDEKTIFQGTSNTLTEVDWESYFGVEEETISIGGEEVNKDQWEKLMAEGCAWCSTQSVDFDKHNEVQWVEYPKTFLCPDCVKANSIAM
jgi:glucosamine 6-phosphate synthetase-like amidotransferase/phosphosugar isomerase protein